MGNAKCSNVVGVANTDGKRTRQSVSTNKSSHGSDAQQTKWILSERDITFLSSQTGKYKCLSYVDDWKYVDNYNFKKFEYDDDGYKVWHTESGGSEVTSKRILVWTYYLNDAKSGTEFMNFPKMNRVLYCSQRYKLS